MESYQGGLFGAQALLSRRRIGAASYQKWHVQQSPRPPSSGVLCRSVSGECLLSRRDVVAEPCAITAGAAHARCGWACMLRCVTLVYFNWLEIFTEAKSRKYRPSALRAAPRLTYAENHGTHLLPKIGTA